MIREAIQAAVPRMVAMMETFLSRPPYAGVISYRPFYVQEFMETLIDNTDGLLLVSDRDGVDGMLGMYIYAHPLSGEKMPAEAFWWMSPEKRGGLAAFRMLKQAEEWVKMRGLPMVHMVAPDERVARVYTKRGYRPLEMHFYKPEGQSHDIRE